MPINWDSEPTTSGGSGETWTPGGVIGAAAAVVSGSGLNEKAVGSMASEAKEMLKSAKSGGFRVSEEAAKPIIETLDEMKGRVESLAVELENVSSFEPTLGEHDYGKRAARHQQQAFAGDEGSAVQVLRSLHGVLADSRDALDVAMKNYRDSETVASDTFKG